MIVGYNEKRNSMDARDKLWATERITMNNYTDEMAARQRHQDLLRWAEQQRIVHALIARRPAQRLVLIAGLSSLLQLFRLRFKPQTKAS